MHQFSLKCFGVGDGWPSAERYHSSFLYRLQDRAFLIDCGEPISRSFKASGLDYNLIEHIFLSHLHFDHVGGLFMLIQGFWLEARKRALTVHAPSDGILPLRQLLHAGCIFDELLPFPMRYQTLVVAQSIACGDIRVTPFATTHLARLKECFQSKYPQRFEAFSFLIEAPGLRIGHSADIGAIDDLSALVQKPLDWLVCELAHVPSDQLFQFLKGRDIGRILFIHLARECVDNFAELKAQAAAILGPQRVEWAVDGQEFDLTPARR